MELNLKQAMDILVLATGEIKASRLDHEKIVASLNLVKTALNRLEGLESDLKTEEKKV